MRKSASDGKMPTVARKYLRPDEVARLVEAAGKRGRNGFRDRVMIRCIYRHGLRVSEACGLRWAQVDLELGTIHVARLKGSNDSTHTLDRDELRDLRKLRQDAAGPYVFTSEAGGPMDRDNVSRIVKTAGELAELDVAVHPHMLRHAAGYFLANEGTDTRLIQDFLGHKDIRHTAGYTAIAPKRLAGLRIR